MGRIFYKRLKAIKYLLYIKGYETFWVLVQMNPLIKGLIRATSVDTGEGTVFL